MLTDDFEDFLDSNSKDGAMPSSLSAGSSFRQPNEGGESDDEFDPTSLLSSPLFDEGSDDGLNIIVDLDINNNNNNPSGSNQNTSGGL